jgi:hypothetical protein
MSLYWLSPKLCVPRDILTGQSFAVCACWVSCCFAVIPRGFSLFLAAAGLKKSKFPRLSEVRSLYFSALSAGISERSGDRSSDLRAARLGKCSPVQPSAPYHPRDRWVSARLAKVECALINGKKRGVCSDIYPSRHCRNRRSNRAAGRRDPRFNASDDL